MQTFKCWLALSIIGQLFMLNDFDQLHVVSCLIVILIGTINALTAVVLELRRAQLDRRLRKSTAALREQAKCRA